jgi:hypothetical protein
MPRGVRSGIHVSEPLLFDVFGKTMLVESSRKGWQLFLLGADGKRSAVDVPIPAFVTENELAQYLDDIFHESASSRHPCVRRLDNT